MIKQFLKLNNLNNEFLLKGNLKLDNFDRRTEGFMELSLIIKKLIKVQRSNIQMLKIEPKVARVLLNLQIELPRFILNQTGQIIKDEQVIWVVFVSLAVQTYQFIDSEFALDCEPDVLRLLLFETLLARTDFS